MTIPMLDAAPHTRLDADNPHDHHGCYSIRDPRWACVYTHPQAETWADTNLRQAGYVTFLPTFATRVRDNAIPSLWHPVQRPLFPRYLFIRFNHLTESWTPIRATPGVQDLVRCGSTPAYASEAAVSALQAGQAARATPTPPSAIWAPGVPCSLATGPFAEHQAVVMSVGHDMALVALMMFGHLREVAVQLDALQPRTE
jgi:transcriptional antiterminator RfaH